jgi:3-hydroxybutyryl-CoA dehydrogenase
MQVKKVGIVGAGVIGASVAQHVAMQSLDVVLCDVSLAVLERARQDMAQEVRLHALLSNGRAAAPLETILARITFVTDHEALAGVDFVIENATEDWEVKRTLFAKLDALCPGVVLAANTSAISITKIASVTSRPERVVGMHFMNPVPLKPVVEVVRGFRTSEATLDAARRFLALIGKEAIVVNDSPGFVSNRVLMVTVNEAIWLVHDGVSQPRDIDRLFRTCFGHKMGPIETADLIGLDTILRTLEVLQESFGESKYRPCPLLRKMVDAGLLGRKSNRGFYAYDDTRA